MKAMLLVDALNVIGARPNGWWRDRPAAFQAFVSELQALGEPVTVVFDGPPVDTVSGTVHGDVSVVFAGGPGPGAADDRIIELVRDGDRRNLTVVTSDAGLQYRARRLGARVQTASWLLRRLDT
jgi:predicted RNA-binding protein with PIN domain